MKQMHNPAADHIQAVEQKEAAERTARQAAERRQETIAAARRSIAEAERRKAGPTFQDERAGYIHDSLSKQLAAEADDYARQLHTAVQSGRVVKLELASDGAVAYFFGSQIAERLPYLAAAIASRSGEGLPATEEARANLIAKAEAEIQHARSVLASFGITD